MTPALHALALSASSGGCDVALRHPDGSTTLQGDVPTRRTDDLASRVQDGLRAAGIGVRDLEALYLDLGPGSYTGLRVAVTFARTLQHFFQLPVLTTTSLELIALAAWADAPELATSILHPVLDARRERFHHARVRLGSQVSVISTPAAVPLSVLHNSIEEQDVLVVEESIADSLAAACEARGATLRIASPFRADMLFDSRLQLSETEAEGLEPLYLMGSYAE